MPRRIVAKMAESLSAQDFFSRDTAYLRRCLEGQTSGQGVANFLPYVARVTGRLEDEVIALAKDEDIFKFFHGCEWNSEVLARHVNAGASTYTKLFELIQFLMPAVRKVVDLSAPHSPEIAAKVESAVEEWQLRYRLSFSAKREALAVFILLVQSVATYSNHPLVVSPEQVSDSMTDAATLSHFLVSPAGWSFLQGLSTGNYPSTGVLPFPSNGLVPVILKTLFSINKEN